MPYSSGIGMESEQNPGEHRRIVWSHVLYENQMAGSRGHPDPIAHTSPRRAHRATQPRSATPGVRLSTAGGLPRLIISQAPPAVPVRPRRLGWSRLDYVDRPSSPFEMEVWTWFAPSPFCRSRRRAQRGAELAERSRCKKLNLSRRWQKDIPGVNRTHILAECQGEHTPQHKVIAVIRRR